MSDAVPTTAALKLYAVGLTEPSFRDARIEYCRVTSELFTVVARWIGLDSWIGGGDVRVSDPHVPGLGGMERSRYKAFRGIATVVEMAAQLASGCNLLLGAKHRYASAAIVRQLIECEYLLTAFIESADQAEIWLGASPAEIRKSFAPGQMRKLGGFSNEEYWRHCDWGGHPSPAGRSLLECGLFPPPDDEVAAALAWMDFAQHLRRVWAASHRLLSAHLARFEVVRSAEIQGIQAAEEDWLSIDPCSTPVDFLHLNDIAEQALIDMGYEWPERSSALSRPGITRPQRAADTRQASTDQPTMA